MTERQLLHLIALKEDSALLIDEKYRKGAAEHGDDLLDKTPIELVNFALDEAIDQVVYLMTLRDALLYSYRVEEK